MYYLIYTSEAVSAFSEEDLKQLLDVSRQNNSGRGITGMLYYFNGIFIQLIEGDEEAVKELYNIISLDPRHKDLSVVKEASIEKRFFSKWSMGFKPISQQDTEVKYFEKVQKQPNEPASSIMDLFKIMLQN